MMMTSELALILSLAIPATGALGIAVTGERPNLRETVTLLTASTLFAVVLWLLQHHLEGGVATLTVLNLLPNLPIAFTVEPLGLVFALVASGLWIVTSVYSIAKAAFVGGSLVPKGGQNPLEPIGLGVPTCFGPHMENFAAISKTVLDLNLATVVKDRSELSEFFESILTGKTEAFEPRILFEKVGGSAKYTAGKIMES